MAAFLIGVVGVGAVLKAPVVEQVEAELALLALVILTVLTVDAVLVGAFAVDHSVGRADAFDTMCGIVAFMAVLST